MCDSFTTLLKYLFLVVSSAVVILLSAFAGQMR